MKYNVCNFGAVGDGVTDNTAAFAAAIDACAAAGGGVVFVPAGQYVTGTIRLQSWVYLEVSAGATLLASMNGKDFSGTKRGCAWLTRATQFVNSKARNKKSVINPCVALIVAEDAHHVGVLGNGIIDGRRDNTVADNSAVGKPFLLVFSHCEDVSLEGLTMTRPGSFTNYLLGCKRVKIRGLTIDSTGTACGDGIDFDGGQDVTIADCFIDAGDDGIGLKALSPNEPCERFTISNCHIRSQYWGCIRIGPETTSDFRHIAVTNCVFYDSNDGIKLQLCEDKVFENFTFSNLVMDKVTRPFFVTNTCYPFSVYSNGNRPSCGTMRRILFSNISATLTQRRDHLPHGKATPYSGCLVYALPTATIEELSFENIRLFCLGGEGKEAGQKTDQPDLLDYVSFYPESCLQFDVPPAAAFTLRNAKKVYFSNVSVTCAQPDGRCGFAAEHVTDLTLWDVQVEHTTGLLRQYDCPHLSVQNSVGEVVAFTPEQIAAHQAAREQSFDMNAQIDGISALVDGVKGEPMVFDARAGVSLPPHAGGVLVFPLVNGCFTIVCNGKELARYAPPSCYRYTTVYACQLPPCHTQTTLTLVPGEDCTLEKMIGQVYFE